MVRAKSSQSGIESAKFGPGIRAFPRKEILFPRLRGAAAKDQERALGSMTRIYNSCYHKAGRAIAGVAHFLHQGKEGIRKDWPHRGASAPSTALRARMATRGSLSSYRLQGTTLAIVSRVLAAPKMDGDRRAPHPLASDPGQCRPISIALARIRLGPPLLFLLYFLCLPRPLEILQPPE